MLMMGLPAARAGITRPGRRLPAFAMRLCATILMAALMVASHCATAAEQISVSTTAGLRDGTRILRVTTLADDGPGSLRAALTTQGPRVVVFEVSGYVDLTSRIEITSPYLTVAGQTAPDPGVTIRGSGIALRTHDVRFEHFAIYPGMLPSGEFRSMDALAMISRADRRREVRRVVLRNMTLAHATDENLSLAGDAIGQIRVESSLIAKGLRRTGHPGTGEHSMGLLIYRNSRDIAVVGNIIANNQRRNPVFGGGVQIVVANNLVYGFESNAINVQRGVGREPMMASVVGNVVEPTSESACVGPVRIRPGTFERNPGNVLHLSDNILDERHAAGRSCGGVVDNQAPDPAHLTGTAPVIDPDWRLLPSSEVRAFVIAHAGMRPSRRPPMDALIVRGVTDGTGRIIDRAEDDGGWPSAPGTTRRLTIPAGDTPSAAELPGLQAWLCSQHFAVGGAPNGDCRTP